MTLLYIFIKKYSLTAFDCLLAPHALATGSRVRRREGPERPDWQMWHQGAEFGRTRLCRIPQRGGLSKTRYPSLAMLFPIIYQHKEPKLSLYITLRDVKFIRTVYHDYR